MVVFNGIDGKITLSGNVLGGFDTAEITSDRTVQEHLSLGDQTFEISAGGRSISFTLNGVWGGSRLLPLLQGTGSTWDMIMEISGANGFAMIASGCLTTNTSWSVNSGEIAIETFQGRAVDVYASGNTLN